MWGWLIALGVLTLLAILPLGVSAVYNTDGPLVRIIAGPIRLTVFPGKKKKEKKLSEKKAEKQAQKEAEKKAKKEEAKKAKQEAKKAAKEKAAKEKKPSKEGGSWTDFLPLVKLAVNFLGDFRRKLRLKRLEMKLIMAGSDPCSLAVNYGKAWAALGNLMPYLERVFVIKKRDLEVECDFTADSTVIYARLDITITLGRLLALVFGYGFRALVTFIKIKNKRKGGAKT